jgi:hypothetical protein
VVGSPNNRVNSRILRVGFIAIHEVPCNVRYGSGTDLTTEP